MFIVRWLKRLTQDYQRSFFVFMLGLSIFFIGLAPFYMSVKHIALNPLLAEIMVLIGLFLLGTGAVLAAIGYLCLMVYRLQRFTKKK